MSIRITDFLTVSRVRVPLVGTDKHSLIEEMVQLLSADLGEEQRQKLLSAVLEREAQRTTGVGRGLAIPHAKPEVCRDLLVAAGRTSEPVEFESIDGQPVRLVVLLAGPPHQTSQHLKILARLSRMVTNDAIVNSMLEAPTAEDLFNVFARHDDAQ